MASERKKRSCYPCWRKINLRLGFLPASLTRQIRETGIQAGQRDWKTDTLIGRLENDECCGLSAFQRTQQLVVDLHLGVAAARKTLHESGPPDVLVVDLEPQSRWHQHAERGQDSQQGPALRRVQEQNG